MKKDGILALLAALVFAAVITLQVLEYLHYTG